MPDLAAEVVGASPEPYAAAPTLLLRVRLAESTGAAVRAVALRVQLRIEPRQRRYSRGEEELLVEVFGRTAQWGESLRPFFWTEVATTVGAFSGSTELDLPIPCSYDLEVAAGKYFHALEHGEIPLLLLFSGTVFRVESGRLSLEPVPWHVETRCGLPVSCWREVMDRYFPDSCWLRLPRSTLDALARFKAREALPTFEGALEALLRQPAAEP